MTRATLLKIVDSVQDDPLFAQAPVGHPQMPVMYQVAITLWRMVHFGDAVGIPVIARSFGCSGKF